LELKLKKISIITVNLNNVLGLKRTISSVVEQPRENLELIIIDGASTDGSVDLIKEYADKIDYWVSEADTGTYAAMNKGIKKATGEYCLFLNSGDWLVSKNVVMDILGELTTGHDIYYSNMLVSDGKKHHELRYPEAVDVNHFISSTISHQNSLIRSEFLKKNGLYREDFKIAADWFFYLNAIYLKGARFRFIKTHIAYYYYMGMSNSPKYDLIKEKEHETGIREIFGDLAPSILELRAFQQSVYGNIVGLFGVPKVLLFILRTYRYLAKRFRSA